MRSPSPAKALALLLLIAVVAVAAAADGRANADVTWIQSLGSGPCTRDERVFAGRSAREVSGEYHRTVDAVTEEYLALRAGSDFDCAAETLAPLPSGSKLGEVARTLPPWRDRPNVSVTRNHLAPVLRRYLEAYECWLREEDYIRSSFGDEPSRSLIEREIATARPTLERMLAYLQSSGRFNTLDRELQCFLRSSLNLRNALAVAAEASSCAPTRMRNVFDTLRDFPEP